MLNKNSKIFVIYIVILEAPLAKILIYLDKEAEIAFLFTKKTKIPNKYIDFTEVFLQKKILVFSE